MDAPLFICHSSKDVAVALEAVASLESHGLPCWISVRDVQAGQNYQEAIVNVLEHTRGVVFLFSENSNQSAEIRKELSIAGSSRAPVFPLRLSPIVPTGALRYELATRQWIDIFPDQERALAKLAETIHSALQGRASEPPGQVDATSARHKAMANNVVSASPPAPRPPIVAVGSSEFQAVQLLLAHHVGPIAKLLMQKAAQEANSLEEFCEAVAAHVKTPAGREAFLRAAQASLAAKR
jgi:hypothetical protein